MPKTSRRQTAAHAPNPAQLAAVRRLAHAGQAAQARQRLAALRAAFPGHKPLLGLAWEIEDTEGDPMQAVARAYEWRQASPGSRAALEALHDSADRAGLIALQISAYRALQALGGSSTVPPLPEFVKTDDSLSHELAEALELGLMHLHDHNLPAAMATLRRVDHPAARNNLAVALFASGDVAAARSVAEANWQGKRQGEPPNLFALERALRWRCWAEGMDRCVGFASLVRQATPDRADQAIAQVATLRFLGKAGAARQAWKEAARAPYWTPGDTARDMFDALADPEAEWPGGPAQWFPSTWLEVLEGLAREAQRTTPDAVQTRIDAHLDTCDAHADYLARAIELGDAATRELAREVLKKRAQRGDAAALATLDRGLRHPAGTDTERSNLLAWLLEHGLKKSGEPVEVWQGGSLRRITSGHLKIHGEPLPSPFPPPGDALNLQVIKATHRGALHEALALAERLRGMYPELPTPLAHLAAIKEALQYPEAEVTDLYRQAHALDPGYLFARCGLARQLAAQGRQEEARALLDGLLEQRQEMHYSEYRTLLQTQRALALADGERDTVTATDAALAELEKQFPR